MEHDLIAQLSWGAVLIALSVVVQAFILDCLIKIITRVEPRTHAVLGEMWQIPLMMIAVMGSFVAHVIQIWMWAGFYLWIGVVDGVESALYFSASAFTTVGFGDIYLPQEDWRMTSAIQAANGFLVFGWSTAFIFEVMARLYKNKQNREEAVK